jgi:hypothetical protein
MGFTRIVPRPTLRIDPQRLLSIVSAVAIVGCHFDKPVAVPPPESAKMAILGGGAVTERYTAEVWVRGNVAYTTTWGNRQAVGNAIKIWDVSTAVPTLVDSVIVPAAVTLGDVQASDDGKLLVVATEFTPGSIMIYDLTDPLKPQLMSRYSTSLTNPGVHTAQVERVNGVLYAFLCVDPGAGSPARLVIVDLSNPASPIQVFTAAMGSPFVHDVFVRDGILITALWDQGITIWDIGGNGNGSPSNPIPIGNTHTVGGEAHNVWWFHNPVTGEKRYIFVGQEGPGSIGAFASGDIHVIDAGNFAAPIEVAFYHVDGAGTHNFSMDETRGILYAAYYNGGVRAIDVTGDLSSCDAANKSLDGRCDLARMGREVANGLQGVGPVYIWGVQLSGGFVYASDMINGIWKLGPAPLPPA